MEIGAKIREQRLEKELSQEQLAELLSVSKSNISKYENGFVEPNIELIMKMASIFDVSTDYLLGNSESRENYYHNEDTAELAQEIFEDPNLRILLSASRNLERGDLEALIKIVESMKPREE